MTVELLNKVGGKQSHWIGLSSDTKPTDGGYSSTFYEEDTGVSYVYGQSGWIIDRRRGLSPAIATAVNDFLVASGPGAFVKKTLAETQAILAKAAPSLDALATPFLVAKNQTTLTIQANTYVKLISGAGAHSIISFDAATDVVIATALDTGAIAAGLDYYVYVCDDGAVKVSLASTFPAGYDANTSRKIGGFHTLSCAVGTISGHSLTTFATAAILPVSVWCLNFRPTCEPEGMVYSALAKIWVDIYLQTGTGSSPTSLYGAAIKDTVAWNEHVDYLAAQGKKLLTDPQFQTVTKGSNQKTNIWGSLKPVMNELLVGYAGKCAVTIAGKTFTTPLTPTINRAAYVPPVGATVEAQEYKITISTGHVSDPNYFTYQQRIPGGSLSAASAPIQITGAAQALVDGITITFPAAVGFTTGWTITWYVMNGLVDTANRRMISNIGVEGAAGVSWQWLQDQSYQYTPDTAPTFTAVTQVNAIANVGTPEDNAIYLKFDAAGAPYLCSNLVGTADVWLAFGTLHKIKITHDASASGGTQVCCKSASAIADRLVCAIPTLKNAYLLSSTPGLWLKVVYDAAGSTPAAGINEIKCDDTHPQLEMNATTVNIDLVQITSPSWTYFDAGNNEGSVYKQGTYGDAKLRAGGDWGSGTFCGSRCRDANVYRWIASAYLGARGCAEPR